MAAKRATSTAAAAVAASRPRIHLSGALRPMVVDGVTAFQVRYLDAHAYPSTSGRFAPPPLTLQQIWADRKYMARTDPFWWSCVSRKDSDFSRSVIRSWTARRVRTAMKESLAKKGFAEDGTSLEKGPGRYELYGTAQITPTAPCLRIPYVELLKQTDATVDRLMAATERRLRIEESRNPQHQQPRRNTAGLERDGRGTKRLPNTRQGLNIRRL